jgi:hypothetical protein
MPAARCLLLEDRHKAHKMDESDRELLDKQLWGASPSPPLHCGALGLAFVAVFLGGLTLGGILFAHQSKQMQMTLRDAATVLSFLDSSPQSR